ncbi:MAG: mechanosensitive ion channel family protein [Planctomycetota bacterium]
MIANLKLEHPLLAHQNSLAESTIGEWIAWADESFLLRPVVLLLVCALTLFIGRRVLLSVARKIADRTRFEWDDMLLKSRALQRFSYFLPVVVIYAGVSWAAKAQAEDSAIVENTQSITMGLMILVTILSISSLLDGFLLQYQQRDRTGRRAIKGYIQIIKLILFGAGGILAFATMIGQGVGSLFAGLGAMTAVLMLIFKDTILSLVASVQISTQDMVRIGDWIEMPSCGADGDVIDIALHTVKVQNFDKTIVTIPTARLNSDSFKNWRGMQESGGRRIKRSLFVDVSTVRFLEEADVLRLENLKLLREYLSGKREELGKHNEALGEDATLAANSRRLTNLGTFRAYIFAYLKEHPAIHNGMTLLVRQLQPSDKGQPIELYVFTTTTNWGEYEAIQADIFDHLYAVIEEFDLRIFQTPSGGDFSRLATPA